MARLLIAPLLLALLFTRGRCATCMSVDIVKQKLDLYSKKALKMRIPTTALSCVKAAVWAIPQKKNVVGRQTISCIDEKTFGFTMGKSLPRCMRAEAVGEDAKRANGVLGTTLEAAGLVSASARTKSTSAEFRATQAQRQAAPLEQTRRKPVEVDSLLGRITARWDCNIYPCFCYCDSGCHYCCSYEGVGIPGSPSYECFEEVQCTPDYIVCN